MADFCLCCIRAKPAKTALIPTSIGRYERATKYNPNSAEAFYKVAEAEEKLKNNDAARLALKKVMDLSPDSKLGREAKKKLASKS